MCATVWNSASSRLVPASSLHPCSWAAPSGLCCLSCAAAPTSPNALSLNPTLQMHPCHFVVLLTCRLAYNIHLMLHQQRHRNQPAAKAWPHGPISLMRNRAGGVACRPDSLVQQCRGAQLVVIKLQPEAGQGRAGQGRAGQGRAGQGSRGACTCCLERNGSLRVATHSRGQYACSIALPAALHSWLPLGCPHSPHAVVDLVVCQRDVVLVHCRAARRGAAQRNGEESGTTAWADSGTYASAMRRSPAVPWAAGKPCPGRPPTCVPLLDADLFWPGACREWTRKGHHCKLQHAAHVPRTTAQQYRRRHTHCAPLRCLSGLPVCAATIFLRSPTVSSSLHLTRICRQTDRQAGRQAPAGGGEGTVVVFGKPLCSYFLQKRPLADPITQAPGAAGSAAANAAAYCGCWPSHLALAFLPSRSFSTTSIIVAGCCRGFPPQHKRRGRLQKSHESAKQRRF